MKTYPLLVLEHCEPKLSEWLLLEYCHAAKLWPGKTFFTNVTKTDSPTMLKQLGVVHKQNAATVFVGKHCLVLDPQAKQPLRTKDFKNLDALIIGGILGTETALGRTKTLISDISCFPTRHLGSLQLTIDSAVFVAKAIMLGLQLSDIEITKEVEIFHDQVHSTVLPFGYPLLDNKPIITPGLIEYLSKL